MPLAAVDGTSVESRHVSRYDVKRRSRSGPTTQEAINSKYPKVVPVIDCTGRLILAAAPGRGPKSDLVRFKAVLRQAAARARIGTLPARCGLRCRTGPRICPLLGHRHGDPADAWASLGQATGGAMATVDEATLRQEEIRSAVAGGDGRQHDQAASGLGVADAGLLDPVPRDHASCYHT